MLLLETGYVVKRFVHALTFVKVRYMVLLKCTIFIYSNTYIYPQRIGCVKWCRTSPGSIGV